MTSMSSYQELLDSAYELGRTDGRDAGDLEPADVVDRIGAWCRGRAPEEFAVHLWARRRGGAPAGLTLNAPLWYVQGFTDGLAGARTARRVLVHRLEN